MDCCPFIVPFFISMVLGIPTSGYSFYTLAIGYCFLDDSGVIPLPPFLDEEGFLDMQKAIFRILL